VTTLIGLAVVFIVSLEYLRRRARAQALVLSEARMGEPSDPHAGANPPATLAGGSPG